MTKRLQGIRRINAHRDHRQFKRCRERQQLRNARVDRFDQHVDLPGAVGPSELRRDDQQQDVEQPEQEHGVRHVMLEQPDHLASVLHVPV
jgi:hypothetical protein